MWCCPASGQRAARKVAGGSLYGGAQIPLQIPTSKTFGVAL